MKKSSIAFLVAAVLFIGASTPSLFAESRLELHADYSAPIGSTILEPSVEFGASYHFWGIFAFTGSIYTDIVGGGTNILGIQAIRPIGLFSVGLGLKIPLGGFSLVTDWQKFFTGAYATGGVGSFSDSYKIGIDVNVSQSISIEAFSRTLYNFSGEPVAAGGAPIPTSAEVQTVGAGIVLHLF